MTKIELIALAKLLDAYMAENSAELDGYTLEDIRDRVASQIGELEIADAKLDGYPA